MATAPSGRRAIIFNVRGGPMLILPDATPRSRRLLDAELLEPIRINLLVIGNDDGQDVIASKADVRAHALASARRVIWIRSPAVLTSAERSAFTKDDTVPVTVLNLDGRPVVWLNESQAHSFIDIEQAFNAAQQA